MKKLRLSSTITAILGFLSVFALIMLFLALSDIAGHNEDLTLEWRIAGICIIVLSAFTISTFVTLGLLLKSKSIWLNTGLKMV
jgi:cytochrome c biogenesis protein CcdA